MPNVNGQAPRVARDLNWVRRENSWIVIDARKPAWAAVNDIGKEIIGLCRGKLTANEIAGKLSDKYGVAMTTTKRDTKTFLTDMEKAGLVSFAPIKRPRIVIGDQPTQEAVLEITSRCNFRCKTCYVERPYNEYDELSWETLSRFIPAFLKTGAQTITLSGGEPLLHPDFRKVFKLALDSGAK